MQTSSVCHYGPSGPNILLLMMTINFCGLLELNKEIKRMSGRVARVEAGEFNDVIVFLSTPHVHLLDTLLITLKHWY